MQLFTASALLVAGVTSILGLRAYLLGQVDAQLRAVAALAERSTEVLGTRDVGLSLRAAVAPTEYVVELRWPDGNIGRISGLGKVPSRPLLPAAPIPPANGHPSRGATVGGGAAGDFRAVTVALPTVTVLVALPMAPMGRILRRLALIEASAGLGVLALLALLARRFIARALRPLDVIADTATAIADGDLGRRVPGLPAGRAARTEVGRLFLAVDGMLGRIQVALAARASSEGRMRRFVADASHELRTPLTSVRGYLQLLRQGVITVQGRPDAVERADDEAARMSAIINDLLYLARLDAEPELRRDEVDLGALVRDAVADAGAVEPGRPLTVRGTGTHLVAADEHALRQVMANLLANVRMHTPAGAPAEVLLRRGAGTITVEVADSGPGLAPDVAERVFDRFYRAAGGPAGGSGLGLAIVAGIVRAHGGDVGVSGAEGAGTTVWFRLPAAG